MTLVSTVTLRIDTTTNVEAPISLDHSHPSQCCLFVRNGDTRSQAQLAGSFDELRMFANNIHTALDELAIRFMENEHAAK